MLNVSAGAVSPSGSRWLVFMTVLAVYICMIDRIAISIAIIPMAEDNGWSPEHEPICYRGDMDLEVGDDDAMNLADALEFIAGDVVLHEYEVPDQFLQHLLNSLAKLELFFRAGSFRIVPVPKSSF